MKNKLQQYFPIIHTKEEILEEIHSKALLKQIFYSWKEEAQQEFLDFCSGTKGLKILYDSYFKEVFNPENNPERLEDFLSIILKKNVKILKVLPNDAVRLSDEESLLVTDIIIELEDGTLANVEVQKIGYLFPGERAACYGADLLLRQYKRARDTRKKKFSYKDIRTVYTIVFFEKSIKEFHKFPNTYIHTFEQKSDSGLNLELLEKFIFIPLDIYRKNIHNKKERNKLDAWLTFLSSDEPEKIIQLIEEYPEFRPLYQHIYDMCRNVEKVMGLFSEELRIMDRNTVRIMVDQMQEEIDELVERRGELTEEISQLTGKNSQLTEEKNQLSEENSQLTEEKNQLSEENSQLTKENNQLKEEYNRIVAEMAEKEKLFQLLLRKQNAENT